jgi:crossover junction endodeoxyribonuclease RuvC
MGFGLISVLKGELRLLEYGVLKIKSKNLPDKLLELSIGLEKILRRTKPDSAGLEKLFFSKNKKTALEVAQARGVIFLSLLQHGIPVTELTPGEIKVAVTGYGNSDKQSVAKMVARTLKIEKMEHDDNAWDALAVAISVSSKRYE